jgi:peptidoglycan DL-endopeptidase RipA
VGRSIHLRARRAAVVVTFMLAAMLASAGVSAADPAPVPAPPSGGSPAPPNPTDQQLQQSTQSIVSATVQVTRLADRLADAQARADELGDKLEVRRELANKALVDLHDAQSASATAAAKVAATHTGTVAAESAVQDAQSQVDQFVAAAYEQGVTGGSLGLLAQGGDPEDLVSRAQLTEALARDQLATLDEMRRAQIGKVNADSLARATQLDAQAKQRLATGTRLSADGAVAAARAAVGHGVAQLEAVDAERGGIEHQLDVLTSHDAGLRAQRQRYLDYQRQVAAAAKAAASAAAARLSAEQSRAPGAARPAGLGDAAVQTVIDRALSEVGMTYAWGGGDVDGATKGIHDGGDADAFGDYRKIGFDCSGLMMYAFGGVGIDLPHFSGYQYDTGNRVPIAKVQPGDMLFWADGGTIHHVALYVGGDNMVEAPYSGGKVRITPVRYGDGLMPYAVRML